MQMNKSDNKIISAENNYEIYQQKIAYSKKENY